MNIKILKNEIDNEKINSINAEELHKSLEIKDKYKSWIKRRIKKYEFIENTDYILVSQNCETNNPKNRNTTINNYIITLDMAKELAMVQNNEKGREIRKYFIEIEKEFRKKEKMKYLEFEKENKIKSEIYESFFKNNRLLRIGDVCSILNIDSNKLFAFLRKKNILNINNMANEEFINNNYFEKNYYYYQQKKHYTTMVKKDGLNFISELKLTKEFEEFEYKKI